MIVRVALTSLILRRQANIQHGQDGVDDSEDVEDAEKGGGAQSIAVADEDTKASS